MDQKIIIEYLRRSYFAVDGLWFVMIEEEASFDKTLEMDAKVWSVLPKIQARKVKELLELSGIGLTDFIKAITIKLEAEGYDYQIPKSDEDHTQIAIHGCPWYDILKKAKREHLAPKIADAICTLEFSIWLREFGENLSFSISSRQCDGDPKCVLDFQE